MGSKKGARIYVFRHGESDYRQTFPSIEDANDLKKEGIKIVRQNAKELLALLKPIKGEVMQIYSSPHGRTLHTSKIILEELNNGKVLSKEIVVEEALADQRGYDYYLVSTLVNGGNINYKGIKFYVDKNITNPHRIKEKNYGAREIDNIPESFLKTLPKNYLNEIRKIEKPFKIRKRTFKVIETILKKSRGGIFILVTHNANTNFLIEKLFPEASGALLKPGEFFSINKNGSIVDIIFKNKTRSVTYPGEFRKMFL